MSKVFAILALSLGIFAPAAQAYPYSISPGLGGPSITTPSGTYTTSPSLVPGGYGYDVTTPSGTYGGTVEVTPTYPGSYNVNMY